MSLIIKDKIKQLMRGYPTVSDKYNVEGGIVEGTDGVNFGDMVVYGSTTGYYKKATALTDINEFAGFVLATNVKLEDTWGKTNDGPITNPGEAFNLFMNGFIAIALKSDATLAQIKNGAKVAVVLATADVTTADKIAADTIVELPGYEFTGIYEQQGATLLAEVRKIC
jgi:hypothetical protein